MACRDLYKSIDFFVFDHEPYDVKWCLIFRDRLTTFSCFQFNSFWRILKLYFPLTPIKIFKITFTFFLSFFLFYSSSLFLSSSITPSLSLSLSFSFFHPLFFVLLPSSEFTFHSHGFKIFSVFRKC